MAKIEYCANAEKPVKTLFKRIKKRIKWQINATYTRPKRPFKKTINKLESYMTKEYRQTDKKKRTNCALPNKVHAKSTLLMCLK